MVYALEPSRCPMIRRNIRIPDRAHVIGRWRNDRVNPPAPDAAFLRLCATSLMAGPSSHQRCAAQPRETLQDARFEPLVRHILDVRRAGTSKVLLAFRRKLPKTAVPTTRVARRRTTGRFCQPAPAHTGRYIKDVAHFRHASSVTAPHARDGHGRTHGTDREPARPQPSPPIPPSQHKIRDASEVFSPAPRALRGARCPGARYSVGQSERADSSATTTQLVWSCRMDAGQLGVTGP